MIPFFRKIRKKMADDNKPMKYIRYAIGEIVLVVFGILIALQINNWNEQRKLHNTINNVYSIIKSDLQSDIIAIDEIVDYMESADSVFKKIIDNNMTFENYTNCRKCISIISGYPDIVLKKRGLKLLEDNSTLFDIQKDSLIININSFYSYYNTEIDIALREMSTDFEDNYRYWKNNKPWFNDFYFGRDEKSITNNDLINYLLTSDYRNRVGSFYLLHYKIYLVHLKEYKRDALKIMEKIDTKIE